MNDTQVIELDSILNRRINKFIERAKRQRGQYGGEHSFEYTLEMLIKKGAESIEASWDSANDTQNAKAFRAAVKLLNSRDPDFVTEFQKLEVKYGVGGTPVALS